MTGSTGAPKPLDEAAHSTRLSAWAPFRSPDFASMASAQFLSNVGSWMQTVVLEQFVVGSWDEHLRQHERVSRVHNLRGHDT